MLAGEVAKMVGVTAETVRFYTRKGLISATKDPGNGYKIYDQSAVDRLRFITHARSIGFSLKEIEEIIDYSQKGNSPCPKVRKMLGDKIAETEQKIEALQQHLIVMKDTYFEWEHKPDMVPDGKAICCLIEEWSDKHEGKLSQEEGDEC